MLRTPSVLVALSIGTLFADARVYSQTLHGLGPSNVATFVSDRGNVVVGKRGDSIFLWSPAATLITLPLLNVKCGGGTCEPDCVVSAVPGGVSADGGTVVGGIGVYEPGGSCSFPFIWSKELGMRLIPGAGSGRGDAVGVSGDGDTVVGFGGNPLSRWSDKAGWTPLEEPVSCPRTASWDGPVCGVSSDTAVVAGVIDGTNTAAVVVDGMLVLPAPQSFTQSQCLGVSASGRFVVGYGLLPNNEIRPFRTDVVLGTKVTLKLLPKGVFGITMSVADDGTAVGYTSVAPSGETVATVWRPDGTPPATARGA